MKYSCQSAILQLRRLPQAAIVCAFFIATSNPEALAEQNPTATPSAPAAPAQSVDGIARYTNKQLLAVACSPKHKRFAEMYVMHGANRDAKEKALTALGYSLKNHNDMASRILGRPEVQQYVRCLIEEKARRDEISPEWVRGRLMEEATFNGKGASHAARIRALELLGKDEGMFKEEAPLINVPVKVFLGADIDKV